MLSISTPALVFPALSVLMLAYTNKFIAISKRVRALHASHKANPSKNLKAQIAVMAKRMTYIQNMQITALCGFSANLISIACILLGFMTIAMALFIIGLVLVLCSLMICIIEIYNSTKVMTLLLLDDIDDFK